MKQLCRNCGRRFDAELTDGICPYCGRYLEVPGMDQGTLIDARKQEEEERAAREQAAKEQAAKEQAEKAKQKSRERAEREKKKEEKQERKRKEEERNRRLQQERRNREALARAEKSSREKSEGSDKFIWSLCGVLLVILILAQIVTPVHTKQAEEIGIAENTVETAQEVMYQTGEAIKIGPLEREVQFSKPQVMTNMRGVNESNQIVRIYCEVKKMQDYCSDFEADLFLEADGMYFEHINSYEMEKVYPELEMEMVEQNALTATSMDAGWVYFVIPKSVQQTTLWISDGKQKENDYVLESVVMRGLDISFEEEGTVE